MQLTLFDEAQHGGRHLAGLPGERLLPIPTWPPNACVSATTCLQQPSAISTPSRNASSASEGRCSADKIGIAVGAPFGPSQDGQALQIEIAIDRFRLCRNEAEIAAETAATGSM